MIPNLKLKGKAEGGFIRKLSAGSHRVRGGGVRHSSGGGFLYSAVVLVQRYCLMKGGTGMHLPPLGPGVGTSVYPGEVQLLE